MNLISRLAIAAVIGIVTWLVATLIGSLLEAAGQPLAVTIGDFLVKWADLLAILAFIWSFFSGGGLSWIKKQ